MREKVDLKPKTLSQLISSGSASLDEDIGGVGAWLFGIYTNSRSWFRMYYGVNQEARRDFIVKITQNDRGSEDQDTLTTCYHIPAQLNNTEIQAEISQAYTDYETSREKWKLFQSEARSNKDALDSQLLIWANQNNLSVYSIRSSLSKRAETEEAISKTEAQLLQLDGESDYSKKEIAVAVEAAQNELKKSLLKLSELLERGEKLAQEVKSAPALLKNRIAESMVESEIGKMLDSRQMGSTRTGSDGKFSIPPKARYISALVNRESEDEQMFWLVKINMDDSHMKLSNSNISAVATNGALLKTLEIDFTKP